MGIRKRSCRLVSYLCTVLAVLASFLNTCNAGNVIDNCWRGDKNWDKNRAKLANCAVGFGSAAIGGKAGKIYTVTRSDDDPVNPLPGTLRYGVTRSRPLWIVFQKDMNIRLKQTLYVSSQKTIDGRGANVQISNGPCIRLLNVTRVIIHGLNIHDCKQSSAGKILVSEKRGTQWMESQDGDAISIVSSSHVWIDHNTLSSCDDGLVDITLASNAITVSNNRFSSHDKTMLLGHSDSYSADRLMKVTIAFNHFGPNLMERMPRVRYGYAHVANNAYEPWGIYAIGGSSHPTIRSEGNRFVAPSEEYLKQVTWRENCSGSCKNTWLWKSSRDEMVNGAYFESSGKGKALPAYTKSQTFKVGKGSLVPKLTADAGALSCVPSQSCW